MVARRVDVGRVRCERGAVGYHLGRAERSSAELNNTFRHRVYVTIQFGAEPIDHFVQRDELRALDVPMRLLGKERQVDCIGEAIVENADRDAFRIRAEIVVGLVRLHGSSPSLEHSNPRPRNLISAACQSNLAIGAWRGLRTKMKIDLIDTARTWSGATSVGVTAALHVASDGFADR